MAGWHWQASILQRLLPALAFSCWATCPGCGSRGLSLHVKSMRARKSRTGNFSPSGRCYNCIALDHRSLPDGGNRLVRSSFHFGACRFWINISCRPTDRTDYDAPNFYAGWGVREAMMMVAFGFAGLIPNDGTMVSPAYRYVFIRGRRARRLGLDRK